MPPHTHCSTGEGGGKRGYMCACEAWRRRLRVTKVEARGEESAAPGRVISKLLLTTTAIDAPSSHSSPPATHVVARPHAPLVQSELAQRLAVHRQFGHVPAGGGELVDGDGAEDPRHRVDLQGRRQGNAKE